MIFDQLFSLRKFLKSYGKRTICCDCVEAILSTVNTYGAGKDGLAMLSHPLKGGILQVLLQASLVVTKAVVDLESHGLQEL